MADQHQLADTDSSQQPLTPAVLEMIGDSLRGLRFGQLLLVVHEGTVVQVERTERKRIPRTGDRS